MTKKTVDFLGRNLPRWLPFVATVFALGTAWGALRGELKSLRDADMQLMKAITVHGKAEMEALRKQDEVILGLITRHESREDVHMTFEQKVKNFMLRREIQPRLDSLEKKIDQNREEILSKLDSIEQKFESGRIRQEPKRL